MSTLEHEHTAIDQRPERAVAIRRLDTTITADGRTVSFRIAPFGELATCADGLGGVPKGQPYQEELMPGLYDKQIRAAHRVFLNFEHQEGISGIVGHGITLRSESDGYHADFRIHDNADGDKALMLVNEGVLGGASVESFWLKSVRSARGVVQRVKGHLDAVAICRQGAYPSAVLTGIRAQEIPNEIVLDEALMPVDFDHELAARCQRLGIELPQRMKAHPASDTPASSDTSADGTRQVEATTNTEE